jgi:hypothetical protein
MNGTLLDGIMSNGRLEVFSNGSGARPASRPACPPQPDPGAECGACRAAASAPTCSTRCVGDSATRWATTRTRAAVPVATSPRSVTPALPQLLPLHRAQRKSHVADAGRLRLPRQRARHQQLRVRPHAVLGRRTTGDLPGLRRRFQVHPSAAPRHLKSLLAHVCLPPHRSVRLNGTTRPGRGRVEIVKSGAWGTICNINALAATFICGMLGFAGRGTVRCPRARASLTAMSQIA